MGNIRKLLLFICAIGALTATSQAQTRVDIFYETLSDAGRKFFVEQFKLVADNLLDQIDLRLYPYGNTVKDGSSYTCPFNEQQCEANKLHACLLNLELTPSTPRKDSVKSYVNGKSARTIITDPINEKQVSSFVNCFFKNRYAKESVEELTQLCLPNDSNADWGELLTCAREPDATLTDLLAAHTTAEVATEIKADGFAIKIDGVANAAAKTNLLGELCKVVSEKPSICTQLTFPAKVKLAVYYEAFNSDASNYLVKQLGTYYHVLEDFVDIDLIPYGNTKYDTATQAYTCSQEAQCISNKYQALVVDKYIGKPRNGDAISGENRAINFISCLLSSTLSNVFDALEICSNQKLEIDDYITFLEEIKMNGDNLKTVFNSMRTKTASVATNGVLERVPIVTLNGQVDYNAFDDLVQEACAQYTGVSKAGICTKVNLTIIYEPLNHKSRTLYLEQLNPIFSNLYNLINLQMNPAGRAILQPGAGFACPAGNDQCSSMKIHACTLDFFWNDGNNYTDPIRQEVFDFIVCTFKNRKLLNVMDAAELCSEQYIEADAWFTIHGCLVDGTVNGILEEYILEAQSTIANIGSHAIPIVLLNDKEVTDLSHLKTLICDEFDDYHSPDYCFGDPAPKVQIKVFYESMNDLSKYFFTSQFEPYYIYVEEMANIELLPAGNVRETATTDGTCDSYEANSVCLANKIQAFVIDKYSKHDDDGDYIDGTLRTAKFLACYFNHPNFKDNVYLAAEYCTEEKLLQDEWFDLLLTVKSPEGNSIYKGIVDATQKFMTDNSLTVLDPVPWVTLDSNAHSKRTQDDLLQTVCARFQGDKPLECTPVRVQVYYSAINPLSRRFFLDQLIPVFRNLRERIHLDLIPYGLTNPSLTTEQECANKDKICLANKVQACAINKYFDEDIVDPDNSIQWDGKNQTLSFITCMFKNIKNMEIATLAEECGNRNIDLAEEILACARQDEGTKFLQQMRDKTMGQFETMLHAPWIIINGLRSELAESDLKQAICDNMVGDKPDYCFEATAAKVKVTFHYTSVDTKSQNYVLNELYPHYRLLEEIIDIDVVPFGFTQIIDNGGAGYQTICPNGINECRANLIHACIYDQFFHKDDDPTSENLDQREYDSKVEVIEYINCYFSSSHYPGKPVDAAEECVELIFGDDISTVRECAHGNKGIEILLGFKANKVDTLLPHLTYTPWMTVNGKHSYSVEHHIQRAVCDKYKGREKPLDCYQIYDSDAKPVVEIHYEAGDVSSKDFFTSSFLNSNIFNLADIRLVPFGRSTVAGTTQTCVNVDCVQYKQHACLIDMYYPTDAARVLNVIACTFGDLMSDPNVVNECVDIHLDDIPDAWRPIETCVHDRGDALLQQHGAAAGGLTPKISHVPWILINGEHDIESEVSLINEVCSSFYPADKPADCLPPLQPVSIFYETLNTGVTSFFLTQFYQYKEYLDEIGNFTFIPYGLTTTNGNNFVCPAGDAQCQGNIIHACILNRYYNISAVNDEEQYSLNRIRTANFLVCAFAIGGDDPAIIAEQCLTENFEGDLWRDIHFCASSGEGANIYREMGRQTAALSPALSKAPLVTINAQQSSSALVNLFQSLCASYQGVRPPLCATLANFAVPVGIYFSASAAAQTFFREQVYPFYEEIAPVLRQPRTISEEAKLHAMILPDIIPWGDTTYHADDPDKKFHCPEGDNQCYITRLFSCAVHYHGSEPRGALHLMEFALCFFMQDNALTDPVTVANTCTNRVWVPDPFIELDICAKENNQDAYDIFLLQKEKTDGVDPPLTSFPAITVEHLYNEAALTDLMYVVCMNYRGADVPKVCQDIIENTTTQRPDTTTVTTAAPPPVTTPGGSGVRPVISILVLLFTFAFTRYL